MSIRGVWMWCLMLSVFPVLGGEAMFPRHPAPSPDAASIAFSWQGDIWLVDASGGRARRLTAHPATERFPIWSRDGRLLAFCSDRYGNEDVFVMPADGSQPPKRLTFASSADIPTDFSVDGKAVLFMSFRGEGIRWMPGVYRVPLRGGTPILTQTALGRSASFSPDPERLVFVRGATSGTRRGYRGSANRDLWLRGADGTYVQITDFDGDDDDPSWLGPDAIAFRSARNGAKNVFVLDLPSGACRAVTAHTGSDVRAPRASADGSLIAYEFERRIWTVSPTGGSPLPLTIDVSHDLIIEPLQRRTDTRDATEIAIHPEGKLAAFVVHGDVFVTEILPKNDQEIASPKTVQVTQTPGREQDVSWSPDGEKLLFTSDRNGNADLFVARLPQDSKSWVDVVTFTLTPLTSSDEEEHLGRFSPDQTRIAFVRGKGDLTLMDADGSNQRLLIPHWSTPQFCWSPDGKWLAVANTDQEYNSEIWIHGVDTDQAYNVSRHPDDDLSPSWSPDGKRLVWVSKRHADTFDVWGVWLAQADHEKTPAEWLAYWNAQDQPKNGNDTPDGDQKTDKKKNGKKKKDEKKKGEEEAKKWEPDLPTLTIDFDRLWERAQPITDLKGDESLPLTSPYGKWVVFSAEHEGERDLYRVRWDGQKIKRLAGGGQAPTQIILSEDGKTLFYLDQQGTIRRMDLEGNAGDPVPFRARYEVDVFRERAAAFDEGWRALKEWFYDADFHGIDWNAVREKYRTWAIEASCEADFSDVMNLVVGELNASHSRYASAPDAPGDRTGWIGAIFDPEAGGPGLRVDRIVADSPAARTDVALQPGERILAVNGQILEPETNIFESLIDTAGHEVFLEVQSTTGIVRQVQVIPISTGAYQDLRYREWVRQRRALVDAYSNGRLGYLHVQSMDIPSFESFERDLYAAAHGKEGLLIDVRSNGGGWTTDYLMAVLNVTRHAYTIPRDGDPTQKAYPQGRLPLAAWTRPALTLCNEDSYSNAEIFSHAFKELDRGLLVGKPTFGAVISTGGTRLINGGWIRLPLRGWYVASTGMNMENHGAQPDIVIGQPPDEDTVADRDSQLRQAVSVFLENLESDPRYGSW